MREKAMTSPKEESKLSTRDRPRSSPLHSFGSQAPWAEPSWYNSLHSPYYSSTHRALRVYVREFVDKHILPKALDWEAAGEAPRDEARRYAKSGIPFADVPKEYRPKGFEHVGPVKWEELDVFHTLIMTDELARVQGGVNVSLGGGVPPSTVPSLEHTAHS